MPGSRAGKMMDIQRMRTLFRLMDVVIGVASVFLLLDAMLGFTGQRAAFSAQPRLTSLYINSASLSTACLGGFSNERTVAGTTQVAAHGTPFNAYQITLTNIGGSALTIHGLNAGLIDRQNKVFTEHYTDLGGSGLTLGPGQSRRIVEAYGIHRAVAACEVLSWQS